MGSRNFGLDYQGDDFSIHLYWQTIFKENSGKVWRNIEDGLWGLVYKNHNKKKPLVGSAVYEFLHTTDQSGRHHKIDGEIVRGNDNYFNHTIYNSGWAHQGFIIGTPFITSPIINHLSSGQILINNKVFAHHLGIKGWIEEQLQYMATLTLS